jgi:hypothetical protein
VPGTSPLFHLVFPDQFLHLPAGSIPGLEPRPTSGAVILACLIQIPLAPAIS